MKKTRRKTIRVETERLLVVSGLRRQVEGWCEHCRAQTRMVSVEEAATLAGVSQRAIFRWTEGHRLHFVETPNGALQICLNSVIKQIRGNKTADRNDED